MLLPRPQSSIWHALLITLVMSAITVLADTEIRNFKLPLPTPTRSIHPSTPILDFTHILNVSHHDPELWIRTQLQGTFQKWTARISWPGSTPTKFDMEVLPGDLKDDEVIIHLTACPLSLRIPQQPFGDRPIPPIDEFYTTFALVVEPLIFGVLPQTAVPALIWILVFGMGAACVVPYIIQYLDTISIVGPTASETRGKVA